MQAPQLETVLLSAAGQPGIPGTQWWSGNNNFEAPPGVSGRPGQNASVPSPGTSAHDLRVRLSYAQDRPGLVQLFGEGPLTGKRWEISRAQNGLLDCRGGDGGDGGKGENGQCGGQGSSGRGATRYSDATCGGPGAPGGDGGSGTSGADGGDAGNAYVTVAEDDLDTLVALEWMTAGGRGGASGVHGEPGAGGRGGLGGSGCSWTETHSHTMTDSNGHSHTEYYTTHHSRPGAPPGPDGPSGMRPFGPLYGGRAGRNGRGEIRVLRNDLTEGTYSSRYQLVVKDFDVIDENMDGINEPGEFLLVQNIQIENIGAMPSPKGNILKILIRPTPWLEPVSSEPLELPREIAPGAIVRVPGVLRALIKNESVPRAPGTTFHAQDTVALVAYFERLQRSLPEFAGGIEVAYQYPLVMSVPKYLDCVAKGDLVQFSWMIKNISTKAYGGESAVCRPCYTHMSDPCGVFDLKYATKDSPHETIDRIDVLDVGSEVPITEDFQVSQSVPVFTTGYIVVSLMLSDPHTGAPRPITSFNLSIQISSSYSYNPLSQFLLVINGSTPNAAILQTMDFIKNGLNLPTDILNLSLIGSFKDPKTEHNVLWNYLGKSVVIFANPMNYFQTGLRDVWDLLDPWEACMLAKRGTNFLFVRPANVNELKAWASQMTAPAFVPQSPSAESVTKLSDVVPRLKPYKYEMPDCILTLPVKKAIFRSLDRTMECRAKTITKQLNRRLPLRRFVVGPCDPDPTDETPISKRKSGAIAVVEGLPYWTKFAVTLQPHADGLTSLTDYNIAMIVHSLPFTDQCAVFWNLLGYDHSSGMSVGLAYRGAALSHFQAGRDPNNVLEKEFLLHRKACEALSWSIATHVTSELSHFCLDSPWPDSSIPKSSVLFELPFLRQFIESAPSAPIITSDFDISSLAILFGAILGTHTKGLLSLGGRNSKVRSILQHHSNQLSKTLCAPDARKKLRKALRASATATKKRLAQAKKAQPQLQRTECVHRLNCQRLEELTLTPGASFLDLSALLGVQRSVCSSSAELAERRRVRAQCVLRMERDEAWSKQMLSDMVNPKEE